MKRILLIVNLFVLISSSALAACDGGTLSDDGRFCISNMDLNWWSGFNWCKANGMHMARMYEICPDWDGNTGTKKCPVLLTDKYIDAAVTATASGSAAMFYVRPTTGEVSNATHMGRALPANVICANQRVLLFRKIG